MDWNDDLCNCSNVIILSCVGISVNGIFENRTNNCVKIDKILYNKCKRTRYVFITTKGNNAINANV